MATASNGCAATIPASTSGVVKTRWMTGSPPGLQNQDKHLSTTRVLLDETGAIAGYYTLAIGQVDFGDLPADIAKKLPRRMLPVALLAWLARVPNIRAMGWDNSFSARRCVIVTTPARLSRLSLSSSIA